MAELPSSTRVESGPAQAQGPVHYFGIRHHGPGCARSLRRALDSLRPDCILIEGPPEANALIPYVLHPEIKAPVALLVYTSGSTQDAVFYPFADYSPEWQALQFGVQGGIPTRFIDLPQAVRLAQEQARRSALLAQLSASPPSVAPVSPSESPPSSTSADDDVDQPLIHEEPADGADTSFKPWRHDPLDALAHAAGFADGESWWNQIIEERGDGEDLFSGITEAMTSLRETWSWERSPEDEQREAQREAHMRQCVREAVKEGYQRIAVVSGAWHTPALMAQHTIKADAALLKSLPKVKTEVTWVPWTYHHLTLDSGYGAGVAAPGWYDHLWRASDADKYPAAHATHLPDRATSWLSRVARLLREHQIDCSSAHVIEATRLANTLAVMRGAAHPGLDELDEAVRTVMCMGESAPLQLIHRALMVGDVMGQVPLDVPAVPLQRDMEQAQKKLRLKVEATHRVLELDLRQDMDLARSHFLHRLRLIGLNWGEPARATRGNLGTFRESWALQWQPEFAMRVIEASRYGATVEQAACARVAEQCAQLTRLEDLADLIDQVLLAELAAAVEVVSAALQARAALTGDAIQLIGAVPPLVRVFRYGSVRQTDSALLAHILDGLIVRGAIGLPLACQGLDESAAQSLRQPILAAHEAVALHEGAEQIAAWHGALKQIALGETPHALLRGLCCRLMLDAQYLSQEEVATQLARHLSSGMEPLDAAYWLEGFLNQNAMVLLHDVQVWSLVDQWLANLTDEHFVQIVPLVRRSFAHFSQSERHDLGVRAAHGAAVAPKPVAARTWSAERAAMAVPTLRLLLGLTAE
ncbi:DUF5682 family protein [Herbaspirillum rubrisubalbicans]|uniref:DUF5682 family protein n=1 Tax=Herbaspirillum rubrisubalbicans TaxID=80842 RepID=UPI0015C57B9D|nr:DUF5682 family protein [Herbaspirillum rubrisubalbicans]